LNQIRDVIVTNAKEFTEYTDSLERKKESKVVRYCLSAIKAHHAFYKGATAMFESLLPKVEAIEKVKYSSLDN
jgi:hypothetical protein